MSDELDTVLSLLKEKKVHKKLLFRLVVLTITTVIYGGIFVYDILWKGLPVWITLPFIILSYIAGMVFFSKIGSVTWDAKKEILLAGKMDIFGFVLIALYIAIRFNTETLIGHVYTNTLIISGLSISVFFGMMLGRLLGTFKIIHRATLEK